MPQLPGAKASRDLQPQPKNGIGSMSQMLNGNRRMLTYLLVSNFVLYFGFQVWQTMFNNYAVEVIGVGPAGIGLIQAVREIPGLLGFLLGVLVLYLSEVRIMALSIVVLGIGMILTGGASGMVFLLVATFTMSTGFHFFDGASNAVVLMSESKRQAPRTLGVVGSLTSMAAVAASVVVILLAQPMGYRWLYVAVGAVAVVGGLILLPFRGAKEALPAGRNIILRRRYWLYYALAFLMGSRRHIFTTFAILLLVRDYGIPIQATAVLFLVNSLINVVTLRLAGTLVARLGERVVLSASFGLLVFVFLGYAYVSTLPVLFVLFVLDSILFGASLALTTYFQKIAVTQEEITSNVSVQQTINHISAVIIPIVGGTAWELFGSQAPFLVGVVIVLVSLVLTQFLRTKPDAGAAPAIVVA
jgi:predicted MFS family arabinose efflux permease